MKPSLSNPLLSTALLLAAILPLSAADLTWDSGNTANGATINPADGTWNTTAGNIVWNNAGTNVVWSAANVAMFGGADGTYAIGVVGPFNVQRIQFNNSGYTLSAGTVQTITVTAGGSTTTQPGIGVSSGKTATIGSNVTITEDTGTIYIGALNGASGGTLNIEGTVYGFAAGSSTVIDGVGTIVNVKTGGTLRSQTGSGNGSISVGQLENSNNSLNVQGGDILVQNTGSGAFVVGNRGQATVTLTSGNITVNASATGGVTFSADATYNIGKSNTLHLNGGFLTTSIVQKGGGTSTATFNFNGGTLVANADKTNFMTGLNAANVKDGGAKIDTQAFNIEIGQNLLTDGVGGLTKSGSGMLTLKGTGNTYTGATVIKAGTLKVNTSTTISTSSSIMVGDTGSTTAVLDATTAGLTVGTSQTLGGIGKVFSTGKTLTASGTISPGDGGVGNLTIDGGSLTLDSTSKFAYTLGTSSDLVSLLNGVVLSGNSSLNFADFTFTAGAGFGIGIYTLIDNAGSIATLLDSSGLSGTIGGFDATLSTSNVSGNDLILTVVPEPRAAMLGLIGVLALLRRRR